jgi:C4-dicarboxylate transporter, DctM subunit
MSGGAEIVLVFGVFLALLCGGLWVPFAIMVTSLLYLVLHGGPPSLNALGLVSWGSTDSFTMTAVPLFIMLAQILEKSGVSFRIYRGLSRFVRGIPGGLLQTNIAGCALFAAITGSSVATAAAIGSVALPQLARRRYAPRIAAGSLAAGGTLGIMMPPSIALIIYGTFTETSIVRLFMAGLLPGLFMAALFMAYIAVRVSLRPELAPPERKQEREQERGGPDAPRLAALLDLVPFAVLIGGTLGSIYLGLATPTEAAAIGCLFAIVIAAIWGELDWRRFRSALSDTVKVGGNILFIVYAAFLFSYAVQRGGVGAALTRLLVDLHLSRLEFFLALFLLYTILGCLVESIGIIVITVPLLYPVLLKFGIDPIWFGIELVLFVELGQITPPVGINLFVIQSIGSGKLSDVALGTVPFHLIMILVVFVLFAWPELALWLPHVLTRN